MITIKSYGIGIFIFPGWPKIARFKQNKDDQKDLHNWNRWVSSTLDDGLITSCGSGSLKSMNSEFSNIEHGLSVLRGLRYY